MLRIRNFLLILIFIGVGVLLINAHLFSFDDKTTHPKLTREIAKFYNQKVDKKLTKKQINWLAKGSIEEDSPVTRCWNHYYNPQTGEGLTDGKYKYFPGQPTPAWANNPFHQSAFGGDYSWQRALYLYKQGKEKEAFIALGHVIHLLEDMGVPAHTRNDAHEEGDPFEVWLEKNDDKIKIDFSEVNWRSCADNRDCFVGLTSYSNKNFYSKDTIDDLKKPNTNIQYVYKKGIALVFYDKEDKKFTIGTEEEHNLIHQSYWNHLSPKIIGYGAGLIELFFEEAQVAEQKSPETLASFWKDVVKLGTNKAKNWALDLFSLFKFNEQKAGINSHLKADNYSPLQNKEENLVFNFNLTKKKTNKPEENSQTENKINAKNKIQDKKSVNKNEPETKISEKPQAKTEKQKENKNHENKQNQKDQKQPDKNKKENNLKITQKEISQLPPGAGYNPINNKSSSGKNQKTEEESNASDSNDSLTNISTSTPALPPAEISTTTPTSTKAVSTSTSSTLQNSTSTLKVPSKINDLIAESDSQKGTVNLKWSLPENISTSSRYIIRYATSTISTSTWSLAEEIENQINPSKEKEKEDFVIEDLLPGQIYYFAIKTKNQAGISEISNIASSSLESLPENIVINEIQVSNMEFIELYNPTENDIDVSGWYFSYYSKNRDYNNPYRNKKFPEDIIPSKSFYLIGLKGYSEEKDLIDADWQVYSSNLLSNKNGAIAISLGDPENGSSTEDLIVDVVGWGEDVKVFESSPISTESKKGKSFTRKKTSRDTNNNRNDFKLNNFPNPNNSKGEKISLVADSTKIKQKVLWEKDKSPYLLESNKGEFPVIEKSGRLIIGADVEVKSLNKNYPALIVKGFLNIRGGENNPVVFSGHKENWGGIIFDKANSDKSKINYAIFKNGGNESYYRNNKIKEVLNIKDSNIEIKNSKFKNSSNNQIKINSGEVLIQDSKFKNSTSSALIISGENNQEVLIKDSVFENNYNGIEIRTGANPKIKNNQFIKNYRAVYLYSAYPSFSDNVTENNNYNGVAVDAESKFSEDVFWEEGLPYILFSGSGTIPTVATGTTLKLEGGVVVKPVSSHYSALLIEGKLKTINCSTSTPIVFTSIKDDSFAGDTNNDGEDTLPEKDDWREINFKNGSKGELNHIYFYYSVAPENPVIFKEPEADVVLGNDVKYFPGFLSFN